MDKSLTASKKLMKNYLSELLTEDTDDFIEKKAVETEKLNKLFQKISVAERNEEAVLDTIVSNKSADNEIISHNKELVPELNKQPVDTVVEIKEYSAEHNTTSIDKSYRDKSFQAMFFDVAGLTVAVPLVELGGIHNVNKITSLMGKPKWFEGVMIHREEKINVVDTALWVMPEKYNEELKNALNYQYVIMLSNSRWGLLAETLVDTVTLMPEDVKWLNSSSKRPWLAGLVKNRMCALLEVESLIQLLNNGIDVQQI
ncbi:chemotaxis protein CheW [Colwellia sp. RE-S-Sl-9]